jgi:hypothetical protein
MFERIAEWYLKRRGRVVLPRFWIGIAVSGNAVAVETSPGQWQVSLPCRGFTYALNGSIVEPFTADNVRNLIAGAYGAGLDDLASRFGVPPRDVIMKLTGEPMEADEVYRRRVLLKAGL